MADDVDGAPDDLGADLGDLGLWRDRGVRRREGGPKSETGKHTGRKS
jgi:hypothetical protein